MADSARGRRSGATGANSGDGSSLSLLGLVNTLLRQRYLILGFVGAAFVATVGLTLLSQTTYTSSTSLMPQRPDEGGAQRFSGIASQFGIDVSGGASPGTSPEFYATLLRGRELLNATVTTRYERPSARSDAPNDSADLVEIFGTEASDRALEVARARDRLRQAIDVSVSPQTQLVTLSVTTRWPGLSSQVASRMVDLVNQFNLETRRSQAVNERVFVGERLDEAREELTAAEDSLERFLESNRSWQNSPQLRFRHDRLQRIVNLKEQMVSSLAQSYEQARIAAVRSTPVITVVEPPRPAPRPDSRHLAARAGLSLLVGGIMGVFFAFAREYAWESRSEDEDHYREFRRLLQDVKRDVKHLRRTLVG